MVITDLLDLVEAFLENLEFACAAPHAGVTTTTFPTIRKDLIIQFLELLQNYF